MFEWIAQHWIGLGIGGVVFAYLAWWLTRPVSWEGLDGGGFDNAASFHR